MEAVLLLSPVPTGLYSKMLLKVSAVTVKSRPPAPLELFGNVKLKERLRAVPLVSGPSELAS